MVAEQVCPDAGRMERFSALIQVEKLRHDTRAFGLERYLWIIVDIGISGCITKA